MARYATDTWTSASIASGATLDTNRGSLPSQMNIVKVKVVPNTTGGTFDFKIYRKNTFLAADLLALWEQVSGTLNLYDPMNDSSGTPIEANEGPGIPYVDSDTSGQLHLRIINNDSGAHTYTVNIEYETVVNTITGTANQITASASNGDITLSLPQSIATSSGPQFATIELGAVSDTTLARVSAGVISVEGVRVITSAGTTSGTILKNNGTTFVASTETYAAPGTSGNYMKSDGTNWTSAALAAITGSLTSGRVTVGAGASSLQDYAAFTYDGTSHVVTTVGPHSFGGASSAASQLLLTGTWAPDTTDGSSTLKIATSVTKVASKDHYVFYINPTITEAGSGSGSSVEAVRIRPVIAAGAENLAAVVGVNINTFAAQTTTTNATGMIINGPTGGTNNYAVDFTGRLLFRSLTAESGTNAALCLDTSTSEVEVNTGVSTCLVSSLRFKDRTREVSSIEAARIVNAMLPGLFIEKGKADERFGFAAEDVHVVDSRLVYYEPTILDKDGKVINANAGSPRAVDYERYTAILTRVVQDHDAILIALSSRIDALNAKVNG